MALIVFVFLAVFLAALYAAPLTWVLMLFLGNIGHPIGFLALLPGAIALKLIFNTSVTGK